MENDHSGKEKRAGSVLRILQILFYAAFIGLWFKNHFPALKNLPVSFLWALIPLALVTAVSVGLGLRGKRLSPAVRWNRSYSVLLVILVLAAGVRIPYLMNSSALMDSDDGVSAMIAKHISEGEPAGVYFYGEVHEGTFSQHIYALSFRLLGYSVLNMKIVTLLFFLAFLSLQFALVKRFFSTGLALLSTLFFVFPIGHIVLVSLDTINSFPIMFLFCGFMLWLTVRITFEKQDRLIPVLGFLSGLMFWDHQVNVGFIVASALFLLFRFRFRLLRYMEYSLYFVLGALPVVLFEVTNDFNLFNYLFTEKKAVGVTWEKVEGMIAIIIDLLVHGSRRADFFLMLFILGGMGAIVFGAFRKRRVTRQAF